MKKISAPIVLIVIIGIFALMIGSFYLGQVMLIRSAKTPNSEQIKQEKPHTKIEWDLTVRTISSDDEQELKAAINAIDTENIVLPGSMAKITSAYSTGEWAVLYGETGTTGTLFLIAHKEQSKWQIFTTENQKFCEMLHAVPEEIMSKEAKDYYLDCFN